ncbi:ROK family transcriptional regulator [Actinoallomurus oryzae]|jgi:predicted NBD/HSP70 family sugar kinase|uniref:ROK family transcriptional regulator n=1 Tax=Actinoallomurus oryzae TaxID=502180 RepID=A0ABP8PLJ2_9ACTN
MGPDEPARGPGVLRHINRRVVLESLRAAPGLATVAMVMERTGLSRPAVTRALSDLGEVGLVEWLEARGTGVGRPAQHVRFNAEIGHVAGVGIDPRHIEVVLTDLAGTPVATTGVVAPSSGAEIVQAAADAIDHCLSSAGVDGTRLWAVTAGTPGIIDTDGAIRVAPSIPSWAGLPVNSVLRRRFRCPVFIDNDVTLAALAEHSLGAASGNDTFAYVHWGERVGTGVMIDGRPYRGSSSAAGELGFLDVAGDPDRPSGDDARDLTARDGLGGFERLVGTRAIRELALAEAAPGSALHARARAADLGHIARVLFELAAEGDAVAQALCERVTRRFATGLAALMLLLDPEVVVIGGDVAASGPPLIDLLNRHLAARLLVEPRLVLSELGENAVARGAAVHARSAVKDRIHEMATDSS